MEDYWQVPRRNPTRLTIRLELPQTVTESVDVPDTESKQPCSARRSRGLDPVYPLFRRRLSLLLEALLVAAATVVIMTFTSGSPAPLLHRSPSGRRR
jgi:hypothetical protein